MPRTLGVVYVLVALGLLAPRGGAAEGPEGSRAAARPTGEAETADASGKQGPSLSEAFARIRSEYETQRSALLAAMDQAKTPREQNEVYGRLAPDEVGFCRRMVELAEIAPTAPGARDALLWVLYKPGMADQGAYGDLFARAGALLVRHHGDDPDAVCVGLDLYHVGTARRDALLLQLYVTAKGHEAKGLTRLALAQYLEQKGKWAVAARKLLGRQAARSAVADRGGPAIDAQRGSVEEYAYLLHLRLCDPEALRAEAERLYEEVAAEYDDVPFLNLKRRRREGPLDGPSPAPVQKRPATERSLADVAEARLDAMHNLIVGKEAPEIDEVGLDGSRMKLSDHRGKVVVLVFWGSWCGPCMQNIPHERRLVERLKGRPFSLLGVSSEFARDDALKVIKAEQIPWPNWFDGDPNEGPIAARYRIRKYPTTYVLDAQGLIRAVNVFGADLDQTVDKLLDQTVDKLSEGSPGKSR